MGTGGRHSHAGPSAAAAAATASRPGLPLRRYSVPEVVMRKASLRQRAAAQETNAPPKKQDEKCSKCEPPPKDIPDRQPQEDTKKTQNISVISERSVVKCETTSQCFSMTLSSSTTTECKVSVSDVPKVPEPCSTSDKKQTQFSKDEDVEDPSRLDTITEHSYCTTVENSAKETEEDQEVQNIMSEDRGSTLACCRHRAPSSSCSCKEVSTEIASPLGKNKPDSASSSVTLDESVSETTSSTRDSPLSDVNCPQHRTPTPYNRVKKGMIRDVCGNKVHVLSETSSFIVFETPSPSPTPSPTSPVSNPYPVNECCCVCTCKRCERECSMSTKRISQTTQTTEDKSTSVNPSDRRSSNVKPQTEPSSATVEATVNRESARNETDFEPDVFGVDSNGNVTFCETGVETERNKIPKNAQTNGSTETKDEKPKDTYLVKTETIEKWDNDKREWTEKKVSHVVQHQPGPPLRDTKTYTLSNRINIANNNPTLVASEIVEIPPSERHAFCLNADKSTCPMCQEDKKEVTLPSIKTNNDSQNIKNEAEFWNRLMGQSKAQTNIPKISPVKETAPLPEDLYPWSKLPEKNEQTESTVLDATTPVDSTEATIVPRYSAVPRTVSMLVNTSSAEATSDSDSECLSCADSLESVHIPRKSNKHDNKPVRGHVLLPESTTRKDTSRRTEPSKVYFIRLSEDDGVVEADLTPVSECMPEKLKEKLVERHTSVRHTEHCRHHEEERHHHSSQDRHRDHPTEEESKSPQHRSMGSQAVIKECATKSTSTQQKSSRSRRIPAIVRVHKCHLEEDVRPTFKAKPYKGVTASTIKNKPSKQPEVVKPKSEIPKPKFHPAELKSALKHAEPIPKTACLKQDESINTEEHSKVEKSFVKIQSSVPKHGDKVFKPVPRKQDQSTHMEEAKVEEKIVKVQSSSHTQTTPSTNQKEELAKAVHKLHNFNHAMQTQTTPPRSVETLTVNLEDEGKRVTKSSQTEPKTRPARTPSEKAKPRIKEVPPSAIKTLTQSKIVSRQTKSEIPRKKEAPKTDESASETENILGEPDEMANEDCPGDRKLQTSSPTPQRLTTPRRPGSIARFRHKFPVIPEEQREVSPSSPNKNPPQRRSPVVTSLNAMSQTEPTETKSEKEDRTGRLSSCSNTDGSRSENEQDSQPMQYRIKVRTSPDFNSQSQQTDELPQQSVCKQLLTKTSGGTQTDYSDVNLTKPNSPVRRSVWTDVTSTEARKTDASTSTSTPRSTVSSATTIQKEIKSTTTIQKETTKSTHSTDTIIQKETTKSTSTQSTPPETTSSKPQRSNPISAKSTQTAPKPVSKPSATPKISTTPKPSTAPKPSTSTASAPPKTDALPKPRESVKPAIPRAAAAPVKPSNSATAKGSWASRGASSESSQAYSRRKAAAIEHVNRLQRLLHHGPALSMSACDDISSGGSCQSDSTHYLSPPEMSTSPGWGARDGRDTSASLANRRQIRSRPSRRLDPTVSTDRLLYRHHEPPRLSAPGPPPSDGAGWTVTVAGGSNVGSVVGGVSSSVDPINGAPELEMRVMIAEATSAPANRSAGSSRWSLTIRNQPTIGVEHQQHVADSASCRSRRPPSLTWPRVHHLINGSASPRQSDSSSHQLSVTGSAIKRKFSRHLD